MYQGNWKCSKCGGTITELPFEPKSDKGLTCRTCWSAQKNQTSGSATGSDQSSSAQLSPAVVSEEPPYDIPDYAVPAGEPMPGDGFEGLETLPTTPGTKPKFEGDWRCAECGGSITSLPFSPRNTDNLKCLDCFKKSKG